MRREAQRELPIRRFPRAFGKRNHASEVIRMNDQLKALYSGIQSGTVDKGEAAKQLKALLSGMQKNQDRTPERHGEEQASHSEKAVCLVKGMISKVLKTPAERLDADADLEKYGIDSIIVMQLTNEFEKVFGSLSKTLFFEYRNIREVTGYFLRAHADKMRVLLGEAEQSASPQAPKRQERGKQETRTGPAGDQPGSRKRLRSAPGSKLPGNSSAEPRGRADDIAIVGLSGRYPKARGVHQFWENLKAGADCITEVPQERWNHALYYDEDKNKPGKTFGKWGGFIDGVDQFDPLFFSISPREAETMDPQERLFLECVYETLQDAGYTRDELNQAAGRDLPGSVGVFVGAMYEEYQLYGAQGQALGSPFVTSGNPSSIANRVSYWCNFHGPSMAIDTMCSSSLVAIHLACQSIRSGECSAAIAGGVNVSVHPNKYLGLAYGKFLSSKGRCESFGYGGDGYVPGEGVGAVLLKPLAQAEADGDHIYGIVKGTAVNHGGKANWYTVPSPVAQASVIGRALKEAGVHPRSVSYVEAHGTGTSLGDPIEVTGLTKAFSEYTADRQFCAIGSAKSNIGHCESAAGIAALTKVLLQLKHRQLAPSLHSRTLNPNIDFGQTPFVVQQELAEWKRPVVELDGQVKEYPRIAGISAFGAGGTNAHVVVQEYVPADDRLPASSAQIGPVMIVLSAKNKDVLHAQVKKLLEAIREQGLRDGTLPDMAYTLQVGREAMEERLGLLVHSIRELEDKLTAFLAGRDAMPHMYQGRSNREAGLEEPLALQEGWYESHAHPSLLKAWVNGASVEWTKLYKAARPQRISLPAYPFVRRRYWLPVPIDLSSTENRQAVRSSGSPAQTDTLVYVKDWEEQAAAGSDASAEGWVMVWATPATSALAARLFRNHPAVQKAIVIHGSGGNPSGDWSMDCYSESSGQALYGALRETQRGLKLLGLIDLTAYDREYEQSKALEAGKLRFLQLLLENDRNEGFKLLQATHRLHKHLLPQPTMQGARLSGLYRMLGAEYKQVISMTMDSDLPLYEEAALAQQIEAEYGNGGQGQGDAAECCYRNGRRYAPKLSAALTEQELMAHSRQAGSYGQDDVILVTGGSRGIGAAVVEHIVSQGVRGIVILGREVLPARSEWGNILGGEEKPELQEKLRRLQSLADSGVRIQYSHASLNDRAALSALLQDVHEEMGAVTGIFHCAGAASRNPAFIHKAIGDMQAVCEPKISGLETLYEVFSREPLNFFTLFSSVSAVSPQLAAGQSDYAMANSYMDSFAQHKQGEGKDFVRSIQWPAWGETGMAASGLAPAFQKTGLVSLRTREGLALLDAVQGANLPVCMPCLVRAEQFSPEQFLQAEASPRTERHNAIRTAEARPAPSEEPPAAAMAEGVRDVIRLWLRQLFISELKLTSEQLEDNKPFDEYGVDSVLLAQLAQKMSSRLDNVTLDPSLLLEHSSITALIAYFALHHADAFGEAKVQAEANTAAAAQAGARESYAVKKSVTEEQRAFPPYSPAHGEDGLAVVGLSCRFPGAPTKEAYWELLTRGYSAIRPVPSSRWIPQAGRSDYGGWVDDIDLFDPRFFLINEQDAAIMDPQARVILEESLKAVCDAGYGHKELSGEKIGVYIGGRAQASASIQAVLDAPNPILGIGQNYLATNISRFFNFRGPSLVLDTACSSAISNMQLAADALRSGRIEMALVGAVNLITSPYVHEIFSARSLLSPDGQMRIFDKRSNGDVLGEGAGVVLLKRLRDAVRDNNHIYGVIKGLAVNNDGRTIGPGSPNLHAQKQVMQEALAASGVLPADVGYIEVNGGAAPITDSLEIKALSEVYELKNLSLRSCALGSVKPNIGHLLLTSGMAGFIRCLLSVHYRQIPPFISAMEPFELYDFAASRVLFNRETMEWREPPGKKRIAALNCFPDGGTNCHALIEEFVPDASYRRALFSQPLPLLERKSFPLPSADSAQIREEQAARTDPASSQAAVARSLLLTTIWGNYDEKAI